jgi:hypothetical protein
VALHGPPQPAIRSRWIEQRTDERGLVGGIGQDHAVVAGDGAQRRLPGRADDELGQRAAGELRGAVEQPLVPGRQAGIEALGAGRRARRAANVRGTAVPGKVAFPVSTPGYGNYIGDDP